MPWPRADSTLAGVIPCLAEPPAWVAPMLRYFECGKRMEQSLAIVADGELILGRSRSAGLRLADRHVSHRHARFFAREGRIFVEDIGSRWGTRLNGNPLLQREPLSHGDIILAGTSRLQYTCFADL